MARLRVLKPQRQIPDSIIKGLKQITTEMRTGEVTDVAIVCRRRNGEITTAFSVRQNYPGVIGGLEWLKERVFTSWREEA